MSLTYTVLNWPNFSLEGLNQTEHHKAFHQTILYYDTNEHKELYFEILVYQRKYIF